MSLKEQAGEKLQHMFQAMKMLALLGAVGLQAPALVRAGSAGKESRKIQKDPEKHLSSGL